MGKRTWTLAVENLKAFIPGRTATLELNDDLGTGRIDLGGYIPGILFGSGAPVDASTGAGASAANSFYFDTDGLVLYVNTGTQAAPSWAPTTGGSAVVEVYNGTGGSLAAGTLVYLSGWDATAARFKVAKADADANLSAQYVLPAAIASAANGVAVQAFKLTGQNVGGTVGDPVYLSATAGGWTLTDPGGAGAMSQIVGRVEAVDATTGIVEFSIQAVRKIGSSEIQDGAIIAALLGALSVLPSKQGIAVWNASGSSIAADQLVALSGFDVTSGKPKIVLADADAGLPAAGITVAAIGNGAAGVIARAATSGAVDTSGAGSAGDPVYLSSTAGGFVYALPAALNLVQRVGSVIVKNASGSIAWLIEDPVVIPQTGIQPNSLDFAVIKNGALADVIAAVDGVLQITIPDASGNIDLVSTHKVKVIDAWAVADTNTPDVASTLEIRNGTTNAIVPAASLTWVAVANGIIRALSLVNTYQVVAAAATIRVVAVKTVHVGCTLYIRVARSE